MKLGFWKTKKHFENKEINSTNAVYSVKLFSPQKCYKWLYYNGELRLTFLYCIMSINDTCLYFSHMPTDIFYAL